jgi:hypothetical protein
MQFDKALKSAQSLLERIENGNLKVKPRSLDAPSNVAPFARISSQSTNSSQGFLWKPVSEADGRLVVLLPPALSGNIVSAGIYSNLPANDDNKLEEGRFAGDDHNGGRAHFRFSKPGSQYPDGVYVVAELRNGQRATFEIADSSSRNT